MWEEVDDSVSGETNDTAVHLKEDGYSSPVSVHQVHSGTNICGPVPVSQNSRTKDYDAPSADSLLESEKISYERLHQNKSNDAKFHRFSDPFMQAVDEAAVAAVIIARAREARDSAERAFHLAKGACCAANASLEVAEYVAKCARVTAHIAMDICNFATFDEAYRQTKGHKISLDDFQTVLRFPENKPESLTPFSGSNDELRNIRYSSESTVSGGHRVLESDFLFDSEYSVSSLSSQHHLGPNVSHKVRLWEDKAVCDRPLSAKSPQRAWSSYTERAASCPPSNGRFHDHEERYPSMVSPDRVAISNPRSLRYDASRPSVDEMYHFTERERRGRCQTERRCHRQVNSGYNGRMNCLDVEINPSSSDDNESPETKTLKPKRSKQLQRITDAESESPITKMYARRRRRTSSSGTDSPERPVSPLVYGEHSQKRLDMQLLPASRPQTFHPGKLRSDTAFDKEKFDKDLL